MSLEITINDAIKQAMLGKKEIDLRALRAIKSAILLVKTSGSAAEMTNDDEIKLLQKLVKTRKDSLDIYTTQNRPDLAIKEQEEIEVIERYLPAQMNDNDLKAALQAIIAEAGITSPTEMGKLMGLANKQLAGKADGKRISALAKELL